jgi:hypothetical protein
VNDDRKGNGVAAVRDTLEKAPDFQPQTPLDEVDVAALKIKHRDLITELDRLAEMKRRAENGEIEHAVFEAERLALAEKYKKQGMTPAKALAAVEQRLRPAMDADEAKRRLAEGGSQRDEVLQLGLAGELWHDADHEAFATIRRDGHRETWKVRSRDYRLYLIAEYRRRHSRVPANQALSEGIDAIEATARDGALFEVFVRVAGAFGKVYLDLVNDNWTVVEIDTAGWSLISDPPVRFVRPRGLRPLPTPEPSSNFAGIRELEELVNLHGDNFKLYVGWIVGCLRPAGPYTILVLVGEQGSAKSTAVRIACDLIDPCKVKTSGLPRSEQDLAIAASKRHVLPYDNLSQIHGSMADALCRLATGGGLQKRMLYTDDEQNLIAVCRPVALTSIPDVSSRADLADREIVLVLDRISKERRRTEEEVWVAFEESAPVILGALLDGVSRALRDHRGQMKAMKEKPRMADFAGWAAAAAPAFGWTSTEFLDAYKTNQEEAIERVLEADAVAEAIIELTGQAYSWEPDSADPAKRVWKGTTNNLLAEITRLVPENTRRDRGWPKDATRLSGRLRRAAPALASKGIRIDRSRSKERPELSDGRKGQPCRMITITAPLPDDCR